MHLLNDKQYAYEISHSDEDMMSSMGGRRCDSPCVAIFTNTQNSVLKKIKQDYEKEGYDAEICYNEDVLQEMKKCPEIFVNYINIKSEYEFCLDDFSWIYAVVQDEYKVFSDYKAKGHIINICRISNEDIDTTDAIRRLVEGLGWALGNHNIIINGIIVGNEIEYYSWSLWMRYLSSKYGDILTGTVINLTNKVDDFLRIHPC